MTVRDERFEALLGKAAPLVAAVFDALPDAIGVVWPIVDGTGALVDFEVGYTNPSSERMMGVRLGDEAGARLREVMPGVVPMGLYDRLLRVAESRQAESAEITLDTCILASPMLPPSIKTLMTNSPKYAYYAPSLLNTRVTFGSLADCVRSAVEGRVIRDESAWS